MFALGKRTGMWQGGKSRQEARRLSFAWLAYLPVSASLCAASSAEAVSYAKFGSAIRTKGSREDFFLLVFLYGRFLCFNGLNKSIPLVMAQMCSAGWAIHVSVRKPGTKIQIVIRIRNRHFTGWAGLPIDQSAMPFCPLKSHVAILLLR